MKMFNHSYTEILNIYKYQIYLIITFNGDNNIPENFREQ